MNNIRTRFRFTAVPLLAGLVVALGSACAPPPPSVPVGIAFNPPTIAYVGKTYVPKATAANKLPVGFSLDAASTGCELSPALVNFTAVGSCVILANQPGDATNPPLPQVKRTIRVYECPPLRAGLWTGPQGTSANVILNGSTFSGTVDLSSFGAGVQPFLGTINCDLVQLNFNGTALVGRLSVSGLTLTSSFQGISVVLNAPVG
ncbi:MAG: hypothetical protein WD029_00975 [Microthrixaceae bacterium]